MTKSSIENNKFQKQMERDSIHLKVKRRVTKYDGKLEAWFKNHFEPTLNCIHLHSLSWEDVIFWIGSEKSDEVDALSEFNNLCLKYN